eukprot:CAMPEP_0206215842 /NCGR_PEP_ID=MMETSP0047_2-20121206/2408_1 /ASSEMBLY_ACC=CAM_ASM_000192 /TAXON_ID=195065 /ORGANISM="Chroomonas mesostigmatica_cf, Strain CCMP1168" /LENGTH=62 /DNA_ID=CAMNT_0053638159 /DNA_START=127 /DNA_END=312 /DNA_ORIENTATION=-
MGDPQLRHASEPLPARSTDETIFDDVLHQRSKSSEDVWVELEKMLLRTPLSSPKNALRPMTP